MRMPQSTYSEYELKRRADKGDKSAVQLFEIKKRHTEVMILHRLWELVLIAVVTLLCVALCGWAYGAIAVLILLLGLGIFSRLSIVVKVANNAWQRHEMLLLKVAQRYPSQISFFSGLAIEESNPPFRLHSREELLNLIEHSGAAIASDEKRLLEKALAFGHRQVHEIMTMRKNIVSITKDEILGPLTLTALHKTGHSHIPVIDGGLDRIIGILPAHELMNTERQGEIKVEEVMRRQIFYLADTQTLQGALSALLRTKAHLFIVVDRYEKTVGIITISDVIEALFGRAENGKHQQYEDVHAVASLAATERQTSLARKL
jgi:CBS domain containing-hemolysin-like protein